MKEKLEVKVYSVKQDGTLMQHLEIDEFKTKINDKGELESFEFFFRPLKPLAKVVARVIKVKDE